MNSKDIRQIIIDKNIEVKGAFTAYPGGQWSYICCEDAPQLLEFCLKHEAYSHWTHRNRYSVTIYWKDDESPTGVSSVASFDPKRLKEAYEILGDSIGAALVWCNE